MVVRMDGALKVMDRDVPLKPDRVSAALEGLVGAERWAEVKKFGELDFVCSVEGLGRFRTNVCRHQDGPGAVFRLIPPEPPQLETLGLPATVASLTAFRTGMVLCTGPVGCGKSTTLAGMLNAIASERAEHILTLEDPIEFVYESQVARVNQRQIRRDSETFESALRAALREDPDVIAVTELRDRETISLALTAAETGHFVLGTLHTESAIQTVGRLINAFPAAEQAQARVMLCESLRAIVSQRLVPKKHGAGRVPAVEILMVTAAVSNLIRDGKTFQIPSAMQVGRNVGMQTMKESLESLIQQDLITRETAIAQMTTMGRFE